jgi:hypothetical protein
MSTVSRFIFNLCGYHTPILQERNNLSDNMPRSLRLGLSYQEKGKEKKKKKIFYFKENKN